MKRQRPEDRPRRRSHKGLWALSALAAGAVFAGWQKRQAIQADRYEPGLTVPALVRSALIEGLVMRWEDHGEPPHVARPAALGVEEAALEAPAEKADREQHANRPPVVLIHGFMTHPRLWRRVIPRLGPDSRCLAWEMPGFGHSINEGLSRDISIKAQVRYLLAWMDHLEITRAVLVGHEAGGCVLQALIAQHPERVAGLVLIDTPAVENPVSPVASGLSRMAGVIEKMPPMLLRPLFHDALHRLGHEGLRREMPSISLWWAPYSQPTGPAGLARQARALNEAPPLPLTPALPLTPPLPVRLVYGARAPRALEAADTLAIRLAAPAVRFTPDGGHFNPEDYPEVVAEEIRAVIEKASTTA